MMGYKRQVQQTDSKQEQFLYESRDREWVKCGRYGKLVPENKGAAT